MNKILLALLFCFNLLANPYCLDSLNSLFKDKDFKNTKVQEFLNLQSSITMHKLAYSTLRSSNTKAEFRLEDQILGLLKDQVSKNDDPQMKAIYDEFKSSHNNVSRNSLAKILPLIKDVLNDQVNEESNFERSKFNINADDLKMLSILAEKENQSNGVYDSRQFKSHSSDNSILNFVKIINSSIRNTNSDKDSILKRMDKRIEEMNNKAFTLISDLSKDCEAYLKACSEKNKSNIILPQKVSSLFLAISEEIESPEKYKYLKYGDAWLYTGKSTLKLNQGTNLVRKKYSEQIEKKYFAQDVKVIQNHLVNKVLRSMPYFFTKEELLADKELTVSLAQALDEDAKYFYYKGKKYQFPELYKKKAVELKFSSNYIKDKMIKFGLKVTGNYPEAKGPTKLQNCPNEVISCKDLLNARIDQYQSRGHRGVVIYKDEFYSMKDLTVLKKSKKKFLDALYIDDKGKDIKSPFNLKEEEIKTIANEVRLDNESVILDNKLTHISGLEVDFDKEHARAKKRYEIASKDDNNKDPFPTKEHINSFSSNPFMTLKVKKAIVDGKKTASFDNKVIDTSSLNVKFLDSSTKASRLAAINNKETFYVDNNKLYYTKSGKSTDSKRSVANTAGFDSYEDIKNENIRINSLDEEFKIIEYHKNIDNSCDYYTIVDKQNVTLSVYSNNGEVLLSSEILVGKKKGDERTKYTIYKKNKRETNNSTGAGNFKFKGAQRVSQTGEEYLAIADVVGGISKVSKYSPDMYSLFNDNNLQNNRATSGGIVVPSNKYNSLKKYIKEGCPYYVLPEVKSNKFIVQNENIYYNKVKKDKSSDEIKIIIDPSYEINSKTLSFIHTLESEKSSLMKELKLTNDEYNDLAKLSVGILGVESKFSKTDLFDDGILNVNRYGVKNSWLGGLVVFGGKALKRGEFDWDGSQRSRGPTQIKNIDTYMKGTKYSYIDKKSVNNPKESAIATMYVLTDKLKQLKNRQVSNDAINSENRMDYLYFFYMGQGSKVKNETATPDLNPKVMAVNEISSKVHILTK